MNRKLVAFSMSVACLILAGGASAATTIIGNVSQSSSQGVNSSQSASNGAGGGSTYILGNSSPTTIQTSSNVLSNTECIGACSAVYGGPAFSNLTLIGNASQVNQQAVNSSQSAQNGAGGGTGVLFIGGSSTGVLTQDSFNVLFNDIILGG